MIDLYNFIIHSLTQAESDKQTKIVTSNIASNNIFGILYALE
jgi:hypothetical protein